MKLLCLVRKREKEKDIQRDSGKEKWAIGSMQHEGLGLDFCKPKVMDSGRALLPLQLSRD